MESCVLHVCKEEQKWNKSMQLIDFPAVRLLAPTSTERRDVEDG
jgi:hypothetical protein